MEKTRKCPKCDAEMSKKNLTNWLGVKWQFFLGIFLSKKKLVFYTCKNCGFVEVWTEK